MIARAHSTQAKPSGTPAASSDKKPSPRYTICVLPFANMSGDPDQEYFSDGITEDIITDLSKVSSLRIISRNSAFQYKGEKLNVPELVREMKVTHVLEGSVRKAGGRVRISAQLVDCEDNGHIWAERYDRDTSDIFALQDEISRAIAKALRLRLLPEEKKAIERRGTDSADAYDLYLMARQMYVSGQEYDEHAAQAIIRMCTGATEIDPNYAQAWALMAIGYRSLMALGVGTESGMAAAERALAIDRNLAEAHAVKAFILLENGQADAAESEAAVALKLDPESYEANRAAARVNYQLHRFEHAIRLYEKAVRLMEADINSAMSLVSSYTAIGDATGVRRSAEMALKRAEAILARDQNNPAVLAYSAYALMALGEADRAKARMNRALMIDPDNFNMRYNFACALCVYLKDKEAALEMLRSVYKTISDPFLRLAQSDPDFALLRDDPRYQAMVAAAEARLAAAKDAVPATVEGADAHG
ncbi:MAG TPA: tetratricopeptide repeat protein [Rhodanobacteraceae bacterium]|nr:tetratricopeptide repeat protein [Rhodanobacteraceae bacterium]